MSSAPPQFPIVQEAALGLETRPRSLWFDAAVRIGKSPLAVACVMVVAIYFIVGVASFFPVFSHTTADNQQVGKIWDVVGPSQQPPRWGKPAVWFGTDLFGRSVFWETLYGARVALEITAGASVLAIGIGLIFGVVAGYFGGWVDTLIIWLFTTVSAVPWILMVIALSYALEGYGNADLRPISPGQTTAPSPAQPAPPAQSISDRIFQTYTTVNGWLSGMLPVILSMGLTDWVGLCRLIRGEVLSIRQRDFVIAAQAAGLGNGRILFRHVVPQVTHLVIITFSLGAVGYVQAEVVLSFIGLGVTNQPSWGQMIDSAKLKLLQGVWWPAAAATLAIFILCLALNYLGDILRDALDPRLRGVN